MAKCYLKLDTRRALKDGTYPVKIVVTGNSKELRLDTGVSVKEDGWNPTTRNAANRRTASLLSTLLTRAESTVLDLRERGVFDKLTTAQLRKALTAEGPASPQRTFLEVCEQFLHLKTGKRTREIYEATMKKVTAFDPEVTMGGITPNWLREFSVFLGGSVNGRAIHLRNIRAVCNYALDEELTQNYPFRKFKIPREETRKRSLPVDDLRALMALDDLTPQEEEYRDMFLLIFYLVGINIADLAALTHDSLVDGRIEYRRAKTGRLYSIKVEPEAQAIIDKYQGEQHLLSPFDRYSSYRDYNHSLNDALKKLGPVNGKHRNGVLTREPINPELSTYWARHSWATIAASLDIPNETIAAALGHSYGNKVTAIYINFDAKKIDRANRQVINHLKSK
jgi:integrase